MICVETEKEAPVAPYFCDPDRRLEIEVRTCNENPCPPRWNVSGDNTRLSLVNTPNTNLSLVRLHHVLQELRRRHPVQRRPVHPGIVRLRGDL